MDDVIGRQAAIDAIKGEIEINGYSHVVDVLKQLPSAQPEQRWIPCSERMPETGQKCLVCEKGTIAIDTYIGKGKPYDWRWYMRDYDAWMPLPEPYAERRTDEADYRKE